jgi:hypothetical protein
MTLPSPRRHGQARQRPKESLARDTSSDDTSIGDHPPGSATARQSAASRGPVRQRLDSAPGTASHTPGRSNGEASAIADAGRPARPDELVDLEALTTAYYARRPDVTEPSQRVAFGTSGHRGSSLDSSFNEDHILATTAAICAYRRGQGTNGPLFMGRDTHALSEPAFVTALEVLVADGVDVRIDSADGFTPTPAISHAILTEPRHPRRSPMASS